ncbi:hypoxanthine-guanine phosphoribosyltransferase-like [Branchiostoma floridae]|uniref:Hypoxanthine phosphoribosyltransferase n=1 Tax=Branchiostoma floridae TaxID=7739 RepID=C3Z3S0_BRAFL|nr:hypoxanthine-guanine phosphoribosyltransferase-like [Branchiostoma floridae]|eukprot:XP_002596822.1 hypothetical protein BRAFLDRAFT_116213 [Branchiostoma floridae]
MADYITIEDDKYLPATSLCIPPVYVEYLEGVVIPHGLIQDRIERMVQHILRDFGCDTPVVALCVLKGGARFFSDLTRAVSALNGTFTPWFPLALDFISVKSYKNDKSTGNVTVTGSKDLAKLAGKNVLIVEDLIDTGTSMQQLLPIIQEYQPKMVKVASLLVKRTPSSTGYRPDYIGFEVPNKFIVGYGIDYNEHFREINHICVVNDNGKKKFAVS